MPRGTRRRFLTKLDEIQKPLESVGSSMDKGDSLVEIDCIACV